MKVVGLDLSLTSAGAVRVEDGRIIGHLNPKTKGSRSATLHQRRERLYGIANEVVDFAKGVDLAVVEAPSYGSTGGSAHDRSGLWWIVVDALRHDGIPVVEVAPQTRAKYGSGKGNSKKDVVFAFVVELYTGLFGMKIPNDDVADAIILAAMGSRHLGQPVEDWEIDEPRLAAMEAPSWPNE